MPSVRERCSCGAEYEITDAPLPNALTSVKSWREKHKCKPFDPEIQASYGGTASIDQPVGFTSGMNLPAKEYDPFEERRN